MRRILVTGASGFVGGHLRQALRTAFPDARLLAAARGESVAQWDETITLDLLDPLSCARALRAGKPDAVIHLAARTEVANSFREPLAVWRANVLGTVALGEATLTEAPEAVFLHASSAEVYGLSFRAGVPLREDAPMQPANPYAASKAAADLAVGEMALRGLRAVRLRPFNHTGPGQSEAFVVAALARQIALMAAGRQEPVLRTGALNRWRDFLDVRDVCAGYVAALQAAATIPAGTAFNLASGVPRQVVAILEQLLALAGIKPQIEQDPGRMRPTDVPRTEGDALLARETLGWAPAIPWEATLRAVLEDWQRRIG